MRTLSFLSVTRMEEEENVRTPLSLLRQSLNHVWRRHVMVCSFFLLPLTYFLSLLFPPEGREGEGSLQDVSQRTARKRRENTSPSHISSPFILFTTFALSWDCPMMQLTVRGNSNKNNKSNGRQTLLILVVSCPCVIVMHFRRDNKKSRHQSHQWFSLFLRVITLLSLSHEEKNTQFSISLIDSYGATLQLFSHLR